MAKVGVEPLGVMNDGVPTVVVLAVFSSTKKDAVMQSRVRGDDDAEGGVGGVGILIGGAEGEGGFSGGGG